MPEEPDYDSMTIEELETESRKNPATLEPPVEPEAEAEVQQAEPEGEKRPQMVPKERFDEVNRAKQEADRLLAHYQNMAIQAARPAQPQAPKASPQEVAEYQTNMELLQPYLQPLVQEIQGLKSQVVSNQVEKLANEAENYVRRNVPDFDKMAPEIFAEIQKYPKSLQDKILGDPDWVIQVAETVKLRKGTGIPETTVKQDLKKRAVSESRSSSSSAPKTTTKLDPEYERVILHGTPAELLAYERKIGKA